MFHQTVMKIKIYLSILTQNYSWYKSYFKNAALAGVAQWIECLPANQSITGLIPGPDQECLGCGPGPQEGVCER